MHVLSANPANWSPDDVDMRSTEVYRLIQRVVGPWCKQGGFRRVPGGMLGYVRPQDGRFLIFWFQCRQGGWDAYAGSGFVAEFQLSPSTCIGAFGDDCIRGRLPDFLDEPDLDPEGERLACGSFCQSSHDAHSDRSRPR